MFSNLGFAAIIAAFAGFWGQIKSFIYNIISFAIKTISFEPHDYVFQQLFPILLKNSKLIKLGDKNFEGFNLYNDKHKIYTSVLVACPRNAIFIFNGKIPIFVSFSNKKVRIKYFWRTFNYEKLLEEVYDNIIIEAKNVDKEIEKIFSGHGFYIQSHTFSDVEQSMSGSAKDSGGGKATPSFGDSNDNSEIRIENYFFDKYYDYLWCPTLDKKHHFIYEPEKKKKHHFYYSPQHLEIRKNVEFWLSHKEWFTQRGLPYKRGVLCYGRAGTGKSRGIREIAKEFNISLQIFYLSGATNETYKNRLDECDDSIILIEDIDSIWNGRENISSSSMMKDKLSFDFFINTLSGADSIKNAFVILTTNHLEKLDPALLRDGRIDLKLEFGPLEKEGRLFIANNILIDWPDFINEVVENNDGMVAAEFENLCIKIAIEKKWSELK